MPTWKGYSAKLSALEKRNLENYVRQNMWAHRLSLIGAVVTLAATFWGAYLVRQQAKEIKQSEVEVVKVKTAAEHLDSGRAFYDKRMYADAIIEYQKAIDVDSRYTGAYALMAYSLYLTKQYEKARLAIEKAIELSSDGPWIRYNASLIYWALNDKVKTIEQIQNLKRIEDINKSDRMIKTLKSDRQFKEIKKLPEVIAIIGE